MRKYLLIVAAVSLCAAVSFAAPEKKTEHPGAPNAGHMDAKGRATHKLVNNVIRVDAAGARTALCLCGKEFAVTDKSPNLERNGTTFYLCSDACKTNSEKATPEGMGTMMGTWREKFRGEKLASNAVEKDGKRMAACTCGMNFEVSETTPIIIENGVRVFSCSEACHDQFMKKTPAERATAEAKIAKGAAKS